MGSAKVEERHRKVAFGAERIEVGCSERSETSSEDKLVHVVAFLEAVPCSEGYAEVVEGFEHGGMAPAGHFFHAFCGDFYSSASRHWPLSQHDYPSLFIALRVRSSLGPQIWVLVSTTERAKLMSSAKQPKPQSTAFVFSSPSLTSLASISLAIPRWAAAFSR